MADDFSMIMIEQIDRLLKQHVDKDVLVRSEQGEWQDDLWHVVSEAGVPHAMVAEASGGLGLAPGEAIKLIRRMGYSALPLPLAETMVANYLLTEAGGPLLGGPATLMPATNNDGISITFGRAGAILNGVIRHVPWGGDVGHIVTFARDRGGERYLVHLKREMVAVSRRRRNIAYEPRDDLEFDSAHLPLEAVLKAPAGLLDAELLPYIAAIRVQQMVGGMERALDFALAYANERVQFGRPIGKFQAVQHMLAVAAGHFAAAMATADAMAESTGFATDLFSVAVAKSRCGAAAGHVAATCHQVHGAMGFTHEHSLHFTTRRLWSWRDEGGSESYWDEWLGRKISALGGEAVWPVVTGSRSL
jgi:acyl-CoA dehydrogenase